MKQPKYKPVIKTTEQPCLEEMTISPHPKYAAYTEYGWKCHSMGSLPDSAGNYASHQITEDEINTCDTSRLVHDLKADPDNPLVKAGPGQLVLSVKCNSDRPSDIFTKPEFRAFVKKADEQDVCWIYFAMPGSGILQMFLAVNGSGKIKEITKDSIELTFSPMDLYLFFPKQVKRYYGLCKLAGISLGAANAHLKALIEPFVPMIEVVPRSLKKALQPQLPIDARQMVNPLYTPGKSVVSTGEILTWTYMSSDPSLPASLGSSARTAT